MGVCVPWEAAHVSTGHKNRKRWEDHITYLRALKNQLRKSARDVPTVLVGDLNQTLPPFRAPVPARDLLLAIVGGVDLSWISPTTAAVSASAITEGTWPPLAFCE